MARSRPQGAACTRTSRLAQNLKIPLRILQKNPGPRPLTVLVSSARRADLQGISLSDYITACRGCHTPRPQDDAHIFCLPGQIAEEIRGVLDLTEELMGTFGFSKFEARLGALFWGRGPAALPAVSEAARGHLWLLQV